MTHPSLKHAALAILIGLNAYAWWNVLHVPESTLSVSVLDVGQGDAILVRGPSGIEMLVDGGPDRSVLRRLPREVGLFDRTLDLVVETHPDKDHIAGLVGVFKRYRIETFLSPGISNDTSYALALNDAAAREQGIDSFTAQRGMRIHMGGGAYADVLYPDVDVSQAETNDGSIVMRVVYGSTSFMLMGDAPTSVEDQLAALAKAEQGVLRSTVLKAGHHGSRTSTSEAWLAALDPEVVVISAGKNNQYGHPHESVVARIQASGARIISTAEQGTLRFASDGNAVTIR